MKLSIATLNLSSPQSGRAGAVVRFVLMGSMTAILSTACGPGPDEKVVVASQPTLHQLQLEPGESLSIQYRATESNADVGMASATRQSSDVERMLHVEIDAQFATPGLSSSSVVAQLRNAAVNEEPASANIFVRGHASTSASRNSVRQHDPSSQESFDGDVEAGDAQLQAAEEVSPHADTVRWVKAWFDDAGALAEGTTLTIENTLAASVRLQIIGYVVVTYWGPGELPAADDVKIGLITSDPQIHGAPEAEESEATESDADAVDVD